jgi:hypothetical protein
MAAIRQYMRAQYAGGARFVLQLFNQAIQWAMGIAPWIMLIGDHNIADKSFNLCSHIGCARFIRIRRHFNASSVYALHHAARRFATTC